jgi:hypothetical protein
MPLEEALRALDVFPFHRQPARPAVHEGFEPSPPPMVAEPVPDVIARGRSDGADDHQRPEIDRAARHRDPAQPHDHFGRDRRKDVLDRHEQENAQQPALLDRADNEFVHETVTSGPAKRS